MAITAYLQNFLILKSKTLCPLSNGYVLYDFIIKKKYTKGFLVCSKHLLMGKDCGSYLMGAEFRKRNPCFKTKYTLYDHIY